MNNKKIKPKFLKEVFVENTLESQINCCVVIKEEVKNVNGLKPICGIVKEWRWLIIMALKLVKKIMIKDKGHVIGL